MCESIGKTVLVAINLTFMLVGLGLVAGGTVLAFLPDLFMDTILEQANAAIAAAGTGIKLPASATDLKEIPLAYEIGLFLFCFGLALLALSFLGCCGACCSCCRSLLLLFSIVMIVLMLIEITFFGLFLTEDSPLHDQIKKMSAEKISNPYNDASPSAYDMIMNLINHEGDCCGLSGVGDYNLGAGVTPASCPSATAPGCYDKLQDLLQDNIVYAGLAAAALLLLQLLEVIFAIVIWKDSSKVSPF